MPRSDRDEHPTIKHQGPSDFKAARHPTSRPTVASAEYAGATSFVEEGEVCPHPALVAFCPAPAPGLSTARTNTEGQGALPSATQQPPCRLIGRRRRITPCPDPSVVDARVAGTRAANGGWCLDATVGTPGAWHDEHQGSSSAASRFRISPPRKSGTGVEAGLSGSTPTGRSPPEFPCHHGNEVRAAFAAWSHVR